MPSMRAMVATRSPAVFARSYFAVQAVAGAVWWLAVFASPDVRRWTLGEWSPAFLVAPDLGVFVGGSAVAAAWGRWKSAAVVAAWTVAVTAALVVYGLVTREAGWGVALMTVSGVGTVAAALVLRFGYVPVRWFFVGPFAFRPARPRSRRVNVLSSLRQLVVFWTTFLVVLPLLLSWAEHRLRLGWEPLRAPGTSWAGLMVFAAASCLGLWACVTMSVRGQGTPLPASTARTLVVSGPYRCVRNPMAVAGACQTVGAGLMFGSWVVIASVAAGAVVWNIFIRPEEEADLAERLGGEYDEYCAAVRCWVPTRPIAV